MRSLADIRLLLDELDCKPADELEDLDFDFKEWKGRSQKDALELVVETAVCMANGGGGTVVFGVNDRAVSREGAIPGVHLEVNVKRLKKAVYDSSDPKITPVFEELLVPEDRAACWSCSTFCAIQSWIRHLLLVSANDLRQTTGRSCARWK